MTDKDKTEPTIDAPAKLEKPLCPLEIGDCETLIEMASKWSENCPPGSLQKMLNAGASLQKIDIHRQKLIEYHQQMQNGGANQSVKDN